MTVSHCLILQRGNVLQDLAIAMDLQYPHGTQASLNCPKDYYLVTEGNEWSVCIDGKWNKSLGICKPLAQ